MTTRILVCGSFDEPRTSSLFYVTFIGFRMLQVEHCSILRPTYVRDWLRNGSPARRLFTVRLVDIRAHYTKK